MTKGKVKVLVLMGGPSEEHEVSLATGEGILKNLNPRKYRSIPVVITKERRWLLPQRDQKLLSSKTVSVLPEKKALEELRKEMRPDIIFVALHGKYGEDGTVQGLLESAGIPYTGSGILASALGMDKPRASAIFSQVGLRVPEFFVVRAQSRNFGMRAKKLGWPLVVKPSNHGSSVGVSIVKEKKELNAALENSFKHSSEAIIQKFVKGREFTCGVLERGGKIFPLPVTEILPKAGAFYDYRSKYASGGSQHIVGPRMPKHITKKIQDAACLAHQSIGCSGMSRSDFILADDGTLHILEINTIPGMTPTSLLPEAAKAAGINFSELLDIIIETAHANSHKRHN